MKRLLVSPVIVVLLAGLLVVGCGQAAPSPTKAPAATKAPSASTAPAAAASTAAPAASKVDWPQKGRSVMVVIPYAAGGATDVGTRMMLPYFEKEFGVSFEAVNKTGAGSQIGLTEIAKAKPDGYTIGCGNLPASITTYLDASRKASYDRASFEPIGLSNADPVSVIVQSDSPYKSIKDLVDAAKANPKKVRAGTTTLTGPSHMALLELQNMSGAQFATVGFDGDAPALTALLGGHLDALFVYVGPANAQVKSGEMRFLGVADDKQNKYAPGVKTWAEEGYKISWATSRMLLAPAGVPKEIATRMSSAM
ncbi:MAG TPA: tripartite tricarboxylate transporter substrate binding protein, partial [Chloroflexota bacterium]|nr:tripartite tricarboxylate transporter substrate binding protein [Chloroflexota bacterium]